jgi:glutamate carboxypeptidase
MSSNYLIKYYSDKKSEFISLISQLVEMQSYSGEVDNINRLLDFLEEKFANFKPVVNRISTKSGDILVLDFFTDNKDQVVFLSHIDTVRVSEEDIKSSVNGNRLYGNGCYDMKSASAILYFVLDHLYQNPNKVKNSIRLIFTPDEETGSKYSMKHIMELCKEAKAVFVGEPPCSEGRVKLERKGVLHINIYILGRSAHSGIEPEAGIDANKELVYVVNKIYDLIDKYPSIHFNPGIISGGVKKNVVSPDSFLDAEMRSFSNSDLRNAMEEIKNIKANSEAVINIDAYINKPALERNDKNYALYLIAKEIAKELNFDLGHCSTGGASDGSNLSAVGIPVLDGLGICGGGAHTKSEYIEIDDFPFRAALYNYLAINDFSK